jgi:hypothetical protein
LARRKKPSRGFALRGVIIIPDRPGETPRLFAADPEAAQRALADTKGLELANPPGGNDGR